MSFFSKLSDSVFGIFNKDTKDENKEVKEVLPEQAEVKIEEKAEVKEEVEVLSEIDALKKELSGTFDNLTSMDEYWEAIVAIEAVATSCASSDKDFSDKEREEIKTFVQKINPNKEVPSSIKEKIDELYANPLPLNKAYLLAKDTKVEMSVFEDIIEVVMHTDGVKFEEKVVLNAWHDFKQAA
ncbi:MAG: Unknown protein [uncultured Sulfurovum sp.]|uniref:Uncharacterized protein n=1 Tax=uncultured Sulfurovum sp. TaxID=269237 RepID=A0A6S6TFB7_9BACT|nr:MAG: Unknown protein [uncultured Sulfurovum sp.]